MMQRIGRVPFWLVALIFFSTLTLLLFGDVLFDPHSVISSPILDLPQLYYPLRTFAFNEMKQGHIPLWNPYVMGGIPAFGNSLYALIYPPNWLHLILPMNLAINLIICLHVMLAGFFTSLWCRGRGSGTAASLLAGSMYMFCGPLMLRIYGGILVYPCVIAWTPLLLLSIDAILEDRRAKTACLIGGAILALQVLAGYMLATYFQVFGIAAYATIRLINHPQWKRAGLLLLLMTLIGGGLCAVQFLPGAEAAAESVRGVAQQTSFSTSVSLPPENLLTLFIPYLLGDWVSAPIFQRWGIVDTSLFIGAVGTILTIVGAIRAVRIRSIREIAILVGLLITLLICLGGYTPLYGPAMRIIPGLALFRGPSRASFMIILMAAPMAAWGFDSLRTSRKVLPATIGSIIVAIILLSFGLAVAKSADAGRDGVWGSILDHLVRTGETWYKLDTPQAAGQISQSATLASSELISAGGIFAAAALILLLSRTRPAALHLLLPLALLELWCGSVLAWDRFKPQIAMPDAWKAPVSQLGTDGRLLISAGGQQNFAMQFGVATINGYDPALRQRWENVVGPLINSESHTGLLFTRRFLQSKRWPMLRLAAAIPPDPQIVFDPPMPRLNLLSSYSVYPDPSESLLAVRRPTFDPRETVVLEQEPSIKPAPPDSTPPGTVNLIRSTTDSLEIEADLWRPAILLITDAYSTGWRIAPSGNAPQSTYEVLVADHALRAVPLSAGPHHFVLEYRPASLRIGMIISASTLLICAAACICFTLRERGEASARALREDSPSPVL